jgi:hypothetical protein
LEIYESDDHVPGFVIAPNTACKGRILQTVPEFEVEGEQLPITD